jgi:hypothetical protein
VTPIQTQYGGRFFRTRGEARYAVFFDACQLRYEYEKEGYWLEEGGRYLPDFWLPRLDCWFEVKSELPTREAIHKCHCLADEKQQRVAMAHCSPGLETIVDCFSPGWSGHLIQTLPVFFMQWLRPEVVLASIEEAQSARFEFGETPPRRVAPLRLAASKPQLPTPRF